MGGSSSKKAAATVVKSAARGGAPPPVKTDNLMTVQDHEGESTPPPSRRSPVGRNHHQHPSTTTTSTTPPTTAAQATPVTTSSSTKPPRGVIRPEMTSSLVSNSSSSTTGQLPHSSSENHHPQTVVAAATGGARGAAGGDQGARQPLKFDQNNVTSSSVAVTSRDSNSVSRDRNGGFTSNLSSVSSHHNNNTTFAKSQNFYQARDKSGRYNSYGGSSGGDEGISHYSGIYNRHSDPKAGPKPRYDPNVASLLKKDKFVLLGSQLQQQESQIFTRNTSSKDHPTISLGTYGVAGAGGGAFSSNRFDPNKFKVVNEARSPGLGSSPSTRLFSDHPTGGGTRGPGSITRGPLDDNDEELIDSIEREFLFT